MFAPRVKLPKKRQFVERAKGVSGVRNVIHDLRSIHSLEMLMAYFDLSLPKLGREIAYYENRRDKHGMLKEYTKGAMHNYVTRPDHKRHRKLDKKKLNALSKYLTDKIREVGENKLLVSAEQNSPLTLQIWVDENTIVDLRERQWQQ